LLVPLGILLGGVASSSSGGAVCGVAAALIVLTRRVHAIDVTAEEWPGAHAD
jgi:energy-converting hydrogenase Eha subunit G